MIPQEADQTHMEYGFPVIRSDKSTQDLAWHIYYYLVSYRTTCAALIR